MVSKTDLINEIAADTALTKKDIKLVIDKFWEKIIEHTSVGSEVQFLGYGRFIKQHREARKGRNPQTGEEIDIPASDNLRFKSTYKF